jgi:hypothetical protein
LKTQAIENSRLGKTVVPLILDASIPNAKLRVIKISRHCKKSRVRKRIT